MRLPNFFIAGAAKAGTTSLWRYLIQHPEIYMPTDIMFKEPAFFSDLKGLNDIEAYKYLFKEVNSEKMIGEASTAYLTSPESPDRIKRTIPDAKIIIMLRNPIDRAYSLYNWMASNGYEHIESFESALEIEAKKRLHDEAFKYNNPEYYYNYLYFNSGLYSGQLSRFTEAFDKENILFIIFEQFKQNVLDEVKRVYRFLGVNDEFVPETEVHNKGRVPYCTPLQFFIRQELNRYLKPPFTNPHPERNPIIAKLMHLNTTTSDSETMRSSTRKRLAEKYADDVFETSKLLDRNIYEWWSDFNKTWNKTDTDRKNSHVPNSRLEEKKRCRKHARPDSGLLSETIRIDDLLVQKGKETTPQKSEVGNQHDKRLVKAVHLNTVDSGGAGKAAYRLHKGLQNTGVQSTLFVLNKVVKDPSVRIIDDPKEIKAGYQGRCHMPPLNSFRKALNRWHAIAAQHPSRPQGLETFTDDTSDVRLDWIGNIQDADVIHLHWVAGLLDYSTSINALKGKPVVWTLHDMNPFTGGCHYSGECNKYTQKCGSCPQLGSDNENDLSRKVWHIKDFLYRHLDLTVVTPSRWMADCAYRSSLFAGKNIKVIPNGLPLDTYIPFSTSNLRKELNIDESAKVILFGADSVVNVRKGFVYLLEALELLAESSGGNTVAATFGGLPHNSKIDTRHRIIHLGTINDEQRLAAVYRMADVFVIPSIEDNLPNTVLEAMACGVPVVGFATGGITDIIEHKKNGYLAAPRSAEGLWEGIKWTLNLKDAKKSVSNKCRQTALNQFDQQGQAREYQLLYEKLLSTGSMAQAAAKKSMRLKESAVEKVAPLSEKMYRKALELARAEKTEDAIETLRRLVELEPNFALGHNDLGVLYCKLGQTDTAMGHFETAQELQPDNMTFKKNFADYNYVALNQIEKALNLYLDVLKIQPDDIEVLSSVGKISQDFGQFDDAEVFYSKVIEIDNSNETARKALQNIAKCRKETKPNQLRDLSAEREQKVSDDYLVSAIVSAYNSERFIEGCLNDLLGQTIADRIEIIVVDSGSDENEKEIVRKYQENHPNVKYIRTQQRETVYAAWNRGIRVSRGKYITNANSDDRHRKDAFEIMVKVLEDQPEIALVYADVLITETENETFDNCSPVGCYRWLDWNRQDLLYKGCFMGPQPMWRREIHREYGFFDESFITSGDYEFWLRASQTNQFKRLPVFLGLYLRSPGSIEHSNRSSQKRENDHILGMYRNAQAEKKIIRRWGQESENNKPDDLKRQKEPPTRTTHSCAVHQQLKIDAGHDRPYELSYGPSEESNEIIGHNAPQKSPASTSIIILLTGTLNQSKRCLSSILRHTEGPYEILLVDVDAKKAVRSWSERLADRNDHIRKLTVHEKASLAEVSNHACENAAGPNIVLLHNDIAVGPAWLSALLECLCKGERAGVVGAMTNKADGRLRPVSAVDLTLENFDDFALTFGRKYRHCRIPIKTPGVYCIAFKSALLHQIGAFDVNYRTETYLIKDFCLRATLMGMNNYIAGSVCLYHEDNHRTSVLLSGEDEKKNKDWAVFNAKWNGFDLNGPVHRAMAIEGVIDQGRKLFMQENVDPAVDVFLQGIGTYPDSERLYIELAEQLKNNGRFQQARDTLAEMPAISRASSHKQLKTMVLKGYCEEGLGHDDRAATLADQALALDSNHAPALNLKGILAYKHGDIESASTYFTQARESDPGYGEAYTNAGVIAWERGEKESAYAWLQKGFMLLPLDSEMTQLFHIVVSELNRFDAVEDSVRQAAALYPDSKKLHYLLIDLLNQQAKYSASMEVIEKAIAVFGIEDGILPAAMNIRQKLGPMTPGATKQSKPTVSLCMIVKNEERDLARCLHSLKPIVDEMVVVDTGSSDRTKDIAAAYGAAVYDYEWIDDFAAARNYSLSKVSGDWILIMDADEAISPQDHDAFRKIVAKRFKSPRAYMITTRNYNNAANILGWVPNSGKYPQDEAGTGWLPSHKVRLFTRDDRIRFEGKVHEMVDPVLQKAGIESKPCRIPVHHYGRMNPDKLDQKGETYYRIGLEKLEQTGDDLCALRELATQAGNLHHSQEAIELWQRFLKLDLSPALQAEAFVNMGTAYSRLGQYDKSLECSEKAIQVDPDMKEAHYNYAMAALHLNDADTAASVLEKLLERIPDYPPALFILTAAYACSGQKQRFTEGIESLKATPMAKGLVYSVIDLVKGLLASGNGVFALNLLQASIDHEIVNPELLGLYARLITPENQAVDAHHCRNEAAGIARIGA